MCLRCEGKGRAMKIEYECCEAKDIKFYKGYTEDKGPVVMCPKCYKIIAQVGLQTDTQEYAWRDQAKKNGLIS